MVTSTSQGGLQPSVNQLEWELVGSHVCWKKVLRHNPPFSRVEKGGLPTSSWELVTAPTGGILFWGERSGRKTDGLVGSSRDMNAASICCGENREKCKGEAVSFLFCLHPYPHLWLWALVSDCKNKITNTNSGMNFLLKVSRLFLRDKLRRWTKS